jgi:hypothetical protein
MNGCVYGARCDSCFSLNCLVCGIARALRRRKRRPENQKDFFDADANSYSAQKQKIHQNEKGIGSTVTEPFTKREIGFGIAECVTVDKTKEEIFARAGAKRNCNAERNSIANGDALTFIDCDDNARKDKTWHAERDPCARSD